MLEENFLQEKLIFGKSNIDLHKWLWNDYENIIYEVLMGGNITTSKTSCNLN